MQFICLIRDKSTSNCAFYDKLCTSERTTLHKVKPKLDKLCNKVVVYSKTKSSKNTTFLFKQYLKVVLNAPPHQ